jgi:quercetin dioxygenase-like cupin family protein
LLREDDVVWHEDLGIRSGVLVETPRLTVQTMEMDPGEASAWHSHAGDELLYVLEGTLWLRARHDGTAYVFELGRDDACLLPAGSEHEYRNYGAVTVRTLAGVAPRPDA